MSKAIKTNLTNFLKSRFHQTGFSSSVAEEGFDFDLGLALRADLGFFTGLEV